MFFTTYETATGKIRANFFVSNPADANLQLKPGEDFVEGKGDPELDYVVDGKITPKPQAERDSIIAGRNREARHRGVNQERDRRLTSGAVVTLSGYGDIAVQGRNRDISIYTNLALRAQQRIAAGDTTPMDFRDRDDNMHSFTPTQMAELLNLAAERADAIYSASWTLKGMDPIPADYDNDSYWP